MAVEIRAATYAALRTALAAGTYKKGQAVFVEAANPEGYGFGTGWFQVRNAAGLTDDSLSTFVGGSYAALRHTGDAWAAYTNAISMLDAPGKHPAFSHTRATVGALCQQFDGSFYQPQIGEIGVHGMRRVRNLLASTDTLATQGVTVEAADYWLSFTGTGSVAVSGVATDSLAGTGVSNRVSKKITAGAAGTMTLTVTGSVTNAMLTKSRAGQLIADPQYVSRGVLSAPYHGWGIDGVRCFATDEYGNDLTDAASGYPVRAAGAVRNPAVTNLTAHSNDFSNTTRSYVNTTATAEAEPLFPGGAWKIASNNATGGYIRAITAPVAVTSGTDYTISFDIKADELDHALVIFSVAFASPLWTIDLAAGTVSLVSGGTATAESIEELPGGWYRVSLTDEANATTNMSALLYLSNDGVWANRNNAITLTEGVIVANAQVNTGADALPYVPTTTASVALAADLQPIDPTAWGYDQAGGVLVVVSKQFADSDDQQIVSAAGAAGESWSIGSTHTVVDGGVTQASIADSWSAGDRVIHAVRIEANDIRVDADGANVGSDASATMPTITGLSLGGGSHSQAIEAVYYFPPGTVTDAQLLAMSNGDLPAIPEIA